MRREAVKGSEQRKVRANLSFPRFPLVAAEWRTGSGPKVSGGSREDN